MPPEAPITTALVEGDKVIAMAPGGLRRIGLFGGVHAGRSREIWPTGRVGVSPRANSMSPASSDPGEAKGLQRSRARRSSGATGALETIYLCQNSGHGMKAFEHALHASRCHVAFVWIPPDSSNGFFGRGY